MAAEPDAEREGLEIDTTDAEDAAVMLADPDDYHDAQRLREIHQARRRVAKGLEEADRRKDGKVENSQTRKLGDVLAIYVMELLPICERAGLDTTLRDRSPWEDLEDYADSLGTHPKEGTVPTLRAHGWTYRKCNALLAEIKPLIVEDDTNEWEV